MAPTHQPLFVYGTLRDPDVLAALLGHPLPSYRCVAALATGWRTVHYPQRPYPALLRSSQAAAPGLLILGLSAIEVAVLDAFEGDEYGRDTIMVQAPQGSIAASVYLPGIPIGADAEPWSLEDWTARHKPAVLADERRLAETLRARYIIADRDDD